MDMLMFLGRLVVLVLLLVSLAGFFLLPWVSYAGKEGVSRWDRFVMSAAMMLPLAMGCLVVAGAICSLFGVWSMMWPGDIPFYAAVGLPWVGIAWCLLRRFLGKRKASI